MKKCLFLIIVLLSAGILFADENILNPDDAKLIALVLETSFEDKGYTVVEPQTKLSHMDFSDELNGVKA